MQENGGSQNLNALDNNNLKDFSFSPTLNLNDYSPNRYSLYGKQGLLNTNEALISLGQMNPILNDKDLEGFSSIISTELNQSKNNHEAGSSKLRKSQEGKKGRTRIARYRKRVLTPPPKARSDPTKKARHEEEGLQVLVDEGDSGQAVAKYTWDNKCRVPHQILELLDRFVANQDWISNFPSYKCTNLDYFGSDHRAIFINTNHCEHNFTKNRAKCFSFDHNWLLEDNYLETFNNSWASRPLDVSFPEKLRYVANHLSGWAASSVGSLARRIKKTQASIDHFKEDIDGPHQISSLSYLEHQLEKLLLKEEVYWR